MHFPLYFSFLGEYTNLKEDVRGILDTFDNNNNNKGRHILLEIQVGRALALAET